MLLILRFYLLGNIPGWACSGSCKIRIRGPVAFAVGSTLCYRSHSESCLKRLTAKKSLPDAFYETILSLQLLPDHKYELVPNTKCCSTWKHQFAAVGDDLHSVANLVSVALSCPLCRWAVLSKPNVQLK